MKTFTDMICKQQKNLFSLFLICLLSSKSYASTVDIKITFSARNIITEEFSAALYFTNDSDKLKFSEYHSETNIENRSLFKFNVERDLLQKTICIKVSPDHFTFHPNPCFEPWHGDINRSVLEKRLQLMPVEESQASLLHKVREDISNGRWEHLEKARDRLTLMLKDSKRFHKHFYMTWSDFLIKSFDKKNYNISPNLIEIECFFLQCSDSITLMKHVFDTFYTLTDIEKERIRANFLNAFFRLGNEEFISNHFGEKEIFLQKLKSYTDAMEAEHFQKSNYKKGHWEMEFTKFCKKLQKEKCL